MTRPSEPGDLTEEERADLTERVERFCAAWAPDGTTDLSLSLPPPGARHRRAVLARVILSDMERRAPIRLPFRVEQYIGQFPDDLSTATVPAELLVAEYRLRHLHTDRPPLADYERWFPDQYPAIADALRREPLDSSDSAEATRVATVRPFAPGSGSTDVRRTGRSRPADPMPEVSEGDVLPSDLPYRLVRKLGAGAYGEVYEARAPGEIPVAVKRIMRSVDHPSSMSERDALEAIKRLSHPFLLKTNAYWILDDRLVIVMELADSSLADRIEYHQSHGRPGVPPEELIPLFEQAGEALDYLHGENVSHRDIKPENILIQKGYAKVADFGLARPQQHTLTVVGNTAGTPAYMAPEMWRQQVSLNSDQYSLAATYVRARLGRALFKTNVLVDMANSHINDTPDLDPLPVDEQRVLLRALAKNPDDRYPSCAAFAEALRVVVFPPLEPPPARRSGLLVPAIVGGLALIAVAALAVSAFTPSRGDQTKEQPVEKEPEKPLIDISGWDPGAGEARLIDGKRYPLKFTRQVGEDTLMAILIYPTRPDHPPAFYMLENKVTNRVFARLWDEVEKDQGSELHKLGGARGALAPGKWKDVVPKRLELTKVQPNAPVLGVTVPEAILVAQRLGGSLPSLRQWLKATGFMEPPSAELRPPAGNALAQELDTNGKKQELRIRDLALGQDEPLLVTEGSGDVSFWKIRQLVSNGPEWLGQSNPNDDSTRIRLSPAPSDQANAVLVGRGYSELDVMDFEAIRGEGGLRFLTEVEGVYAGFRIVLTPR